MQSYWKEHGVAFGIPVLLLNHLQRLEYAEECGGDCKRRHFQETQRELDSFFFFVVVLF